jgi:lambda repressor-like predicted transcriptional regulator
LIAAYEDGAAVNDLARRFGVHRSTVLDHLNRSQARRRYPALDEHGQDVAAQLYRSGLSLRDVGITLGVHASTIRMALMKAGVVRRDCRGQKR